MTTNLSPAQAWQKLIDGNARFVGGESVHPNQDAARRSELVDEQHPFAIIFGCSDSRLAAEIIFDLGLGDAFVVRTAGHVLGDAVIGSLEYGVDVLNVPLIVVLGHDSCGAVTAAKNTVETGEMPRGGLRDLVERITPSVLAAQRAGFTDVNDMVIENVRQSTERLLDSSRAVSEAVDEGKVAVVGVTYRLADGKAECVSGFGAL
ncbi:carbonic anhydrase [Arthrobacter sp. VKM Ac-2550]|uniref:carbonic anhydrase n=1 Tax=Crystallibacter permensis TaxID=1938888 RepID=UPI002225DC3E|nr:carbonic anhydrase [Arthrobacter sp. VKM Ac-2550]MCW2132471.1 carbonic anhydrase [Arthrobacter sp. VKM Ac-2550]